MIQKTVNFLALALDDYRAARLLLMEGLLAQGVAMASTAVEKQLKAMLGLKGVYSKKQHLGPTLLATTYRVFPTFQGALDEDFIRYLGKGFDLRYASVDGPGYSIVINQHRTLMTLDATMLTIDSGFSLRLDGQPHPTPLQSAIASDDPLVFSNNVPLKSVAIEELAGRSNKMFELRVGKNLETLSATYETEGLNILGTFCKATDMDFGKLQFFLARG